MKLNKNLLSPAEIVDAVIDTGVKKVKRTSIQMLVLGMMAGAFIAFGAYVSTVAIHAFPVENSGLSSLLQGAVFPVGLILVLVAGADLFTGNNLIFLGVLEGKITKKEMLKNWILVYIGNLLGSLVFAWLIYMSGLFSATEGLLGAVHVEVAANKATLPFVEAFFRGILCNFAVCLAVWMGIGAKDMVGKAIASWFPIMAFVAGSFEHSIANMYYIPAGILAKQESSVQAILSLDTMTGVNWTALLNNLIPVTMGNIVGGAVIIAGAYWLIFRGQSQENELKITKKSYGKQIGSTN